MTDALAFLEVRDDPAPRSPFAHVAGPDVAAGDDALAACRETVGFADRSSLRKYELHGSFDGLGSASRRDDAWWCPITADRALVLSDTPLELHGAIDLTSSLAALAIVGPLARETFARFCALDLRDVADSFLPGSVARTPGYVLAQDPDRFLLLFGAAFAEYMWTVVSDAATRLGGRAVSAEVLDA